MLSSWSWREVPQATAFDGAAWRLINQRMKLLEALVSGLRDLTVERTTIADGETDPVVTRRRGILLSNSSSTSVVRFVGGEPGQLLVVRAGDSATTVVHSPLLRLEADTDWATTTGDTRLFYTPDGLVWYEVPRAAATADEAWILTGAGLVLTTNDGDYLAQG